MFKDPSAMVKDSLDMIKDFYRTGHPVQVVSVTVAVTCMTLIIISKICGW
jgi:hypothetical protein